MHDETDNHGAGCERCQKLGCVTEGCYYCDWPTLRPRPEDPGILLCPSCPPEVYDAEAEEQAREAGGVPLAVDEEETTPVANVSMTELVFGRRAA